MNDIHDHTHTQNRHAVIPTHEKLSASRELCGRDVTIAFLDSGFVAHPDIASRIVGFHDIHDEETSLDSIASPVGHHWHGTQTVVACAGDGTLSDGVYRGLAAAADLVLVKVSKSGRISDGSIERGLRWVVENREKFDIHVLNMSLGGDWDLTTRESRINQLVEELVCAGVVVTVAAGNSDGSCSIPPASSPSAITVGGYSDENQYDEEGLDLYHSAFGATADGLIKPEVIAPAMYVAAPILPGTPDYEAAELLSLLAAAPDYALPRLLRKHWAKTGLTERILEVSLEQARAAIASELQQRKIVATHYQHVDGTSFSAPIVASVVAQMMEANPRITPAAVKSILIATASRLGGHPHVRQGFGIVNAGLAVARAAAEEHFDAAKHYFPPIIQRNRIVFGYHDDEARKVCLCGDFNEWGREAIDFKRGGDGLWRAAIPCRPAGRYRYKFLVNDSHWIEDPSHGMKEDDGFGGLNSILQIA